MATSLATSASSSALRGTRDRLDAKQLGSIRQIDNLTRQPDGEWAMMGGRSGLQEDFGAFRFQLAYAGLALALGHYHRLPNAPGVFKPIFERLIHKMLQPGVWVYWHYVSQGGAPNGNAHLYGKLPALWDPVKKDNIMYSAYLMLLTRLYHYLFDDDRYTEQGALTMSINPFTFGDNMVFEYDEESLSETIYWQMVQNGYLGVACEPNCIFQICNQPSILSFRFEDFIKGTSRAEEVTDGYLKAWEEFGLVGENGHSIVNIAHDSRTPIPNALPWLWSDAWLAALMHAWNPEHVREVYPKQLEAFLVPGPDGTCAIRLWEPIDLRGSMETIDTADFGWAAAAASELGDETTLNGFLLHADRYMNPTWRDGGLYYPRNDLRYDEDGILRLVEPITTNALLPYAQLNVTHGLHTFYNEPWARDHFEEPLITEVSDSADVLEARFDSQARDLCFSLSARENRTGDVELTISNVFGSGRGAWTLLRGGTEVAAGSDQSVTSHEGLSASRERDALELTVPRGEVESFVLSWS
ncbi:MAG: hypothetical protein HKP27_09770 [Myxococcales bacterium]|nr:hypothetical protein [Myxococcales bacterium]